MCSVRGLDHNWTWSQERRGDTVMCAETMIQSGAAGDQSPVILWETSVGSQLEQHCREWQLSTTLIISTDENIFNQAEYLVQTIITTSIYNLVCDDYKSAHVMAVYQDLKYFSLVQMYLEWRFKGSWFEKSLISGRWCSSSGITLGIIVARVTV